jgi:hypothetical protein
MKVCANLKSLGWCMVEKNGLSNICREVPEGQEIKRRMSVVEGGSGTPFARSVVIIPNSRIYGTDQGRDQEKASRNR